MGVIELLASNGRECKQKRNYHMSRAELGQLLHLLAKRYDPCWFVAVLCQFVLGLRASEVLAIQIWDFKDHFRLLDYRQAKTNKIIYNYPIPEPLSRIIITYIWHNQHRLKDGYLFPSHSGTCPHVTTETYGAYWSKWRRHLGKESPRWLDRYAIVIAGRTQWRYRVSSHSLRRLHRTVLRDNIKDLYIVKELCGYSSYATLQRYINEQEIQERRADYILPIFNPLVFQLLGEAKSQTRLNAYFELG